MMLYENSGGSLKILPHQLPYLAVYLILMVVDTLITSFGRLFHSGFIEANPFFNHFFENASIFISVVVISKLAAIALIISLVLIMNRYKRVFYANIVIITSAVFMAVLMIVLIAWNVSLQFGF